MEDSLLNKLSVLCDKVEKLKTDRYVVCKNGLWSIIDSNNNILTDVYIDMKVDTVGQRVIARNVKGIAVMYDYDANIVSTVEFSDLVPVGNGNYVAKLNTSAQELVGLIDKDMNIILSFIYQQIYICPDHLILFLGAGGGRRKVNLNGEKIDK